MIITSKNNRFVCQIKRLLADAAARRDEGIFAIEGARLCADAALSHVKIRTLLYTHEAEIIYSRQLVKLKEVSSEIYEITPSLSKFISGTPAPQGIFCICELLDNRGSFDKIDISKINTGYIALEKIQDPSNMGTVIRTAEAFGLDGLLLSDGCCDVYNPKVLRGSMGGVFRLPIIYIGNMAAAVIKLKAKGFDCFACVADSDAVVLSDSKLSSGCICVIGNEGNGLSPETVNTCSKKITIPMKGHAESLNAAMAAGIIMWEMSKSY